MISGKGKVAGVMGYPVEHSKSPLIHGFWLEKYAVDGAYVPFCVKPSRFEAALRALPCLGIKGVNITIPHKETAFAVVDSLTERARRAGAVNTVIVDDEGLLRGDNTDGFGFLENLKWRCPGFDPELGTAVVLGAGGAARGIITTLLDAGCPEITIVNRSTERADRLAESVGGSVYVKDWRDVSLKDASLLVNTTSLGMAGQTPLTIDLDILPTTALVADIVYTPLETALLKSAKERGNRVVDGLGMLLHQARPGFAAWFGVEPEVNEDLWKRIAGL